ncbi:MAG: lipopolysaccharide biosynthesis protein [Proteobacteria bacterium]|nr:lipopolysaccharide biosynthesis protein [Pseudomonadota bacterium]
MSSIRKSLLISFAEKYAAIFIQFFSTIILARLLTPEDIGIYSVASVIVGLAHMFRDFGVSQYIVQEKELTIDKIRSAFGAAILFAWTMAVVLFFLKSLVANFYSDERLEDVIFVLTLCFILLPFGSVTLAVLRRNLNFAPIFRVQTASAFVLAFTSIVLAIEGYGFMSLAWASLAGVITTVVGITYYRPKNFPFFPGFREIKSVINFGGLTSIARLCKEVRVATPDMVTGKMISMDAVGLLGRAMGLIKLFEMAVLTAVRQVVLPHLSAEQRAKGDIGAAYLRIIDYVNVLAWPFYGVLFILAFPIMRVLYGSQWDAAVPITQILCIYGISSAMFYFLDEVLISVGMVKKSAIFHFQLLIIIIPSVVAVGGYGLQAVAFSLVVVSIVGLIMAHRLLARVLKLDYSSILKSMSKVFGIFSFSITGPILITLFIAMESNNYVWILGAGIISAAIGWISGVVIFRHPIKNELDPAFTMIRKLLQIRR